MKLVQPSILFLTIALSGSAWAADRPPAPNRQPTLAERLDLGTDQQKPWEAYQAELALERDDASHGRAQAQFLNGMTTPQRLAWILTQLPGREAAARRAAAATLAFYTALRPDQQIKFDRLTRIAMPGSLSEPLPGPSAPDGAAPPKD